MKPRYFPMLGSLFAFTAAGPLLLPLPAPAQAEQAEASQDVEVLTRGPVHEAFAETVSYEAEAGLIVKSAAPAAIEELPPDQRPEGDNVTWIPGYWAWDDDQSDFLWISGIWRNIPPDRQWVPGYWNDLGDGSFQWISGYWADTTTEEVEYVQTAPPKSIDSGPNIAAPSEDHTWVPGNWMWNESRYVWRPGYWLGLRPNWTWVPARYNYSPRGYVYVDGYWDYAVASRGVLFAPVYYRRHVWATPGYYYTPTVVVSLNLFTDHLFIRPRCRHYYFGDYYAPRYADMGFYAGFRYHRHHRGYDPIWAYNRWHHRHDRDWERRYEDNYTFFRNNDRFRPPHTFAAMRALGDERLEGGRTRNFVSTFDNVLKNPERGQRFRPVEKEGRERFIAQRQEMREFSRQRRSLETKPVAAIADNTAEGAEKKGKGVFREKLRRSPVVSRQADQLAQGEAPPKRPEPRGNKALKEAAAAAAAAANDTPGRGKGQGREMAERQTEGDSVKPDRGPAGKGKDKADGTPEPEVAQKDRVRRVPGQGTEGKPERQVQPKPDREKATTDREVKPKPEREKVAPERQVQPKPEREKAKPERQVQPKPERQVQPKREVQPKPERQVQPKREVQPKPERQVQPKREAQPRQPQVKPEKKQGKDKDEARVAPQRSVQRIASPKPQQRQVQPRQQQAQPKPQQRQVQPRQQQAQPKPQQRQVQPRQQQARPQPQQRQAQPRQQQAQPKPQQRQMQPRQPQQRQNKKDRDKKDNA